MLNPNRVGYRPIRPVLEIPQKENALQMITENAEVSLGTNRGVIYQASILEFTSLPMEASMSSR